MVCDDGVVEIGPLDQPGGVDIVDGRPDGDEKLLVFGVSIDDKGNWAALVE